MPPNLRGRDQAVQPARLWNFKSTLRGPDGSPQRAHQLSRLLQIVHLHQLPRFLIISLVAKDMALASPPDSIF